MRGHMGTGQITIIPTFDGRLLVNQGSNYIELLSPSQTDWLIAALAQNAAQQRAILGEPLPFDEPPRAQIGA